jgi:hypothetical protein
LSEGPLLRPEEVAGVLSGGPDAAPPAVPPDGPLPYSLREPVAVPPAAEAEARRRVEILTAGLERGLRAQLGPDLSLSVDGFQQQRAGNALGALPAPAWLLCFGGAGGGMALALAADTGLAWVERAFGGPGAQAPGGREPTPLESRVIRGVAEQVAPALSDLLGGAPIRAALSCGSLPASVAAAGETVGVGLLRVRLAEAERNALLLAPAGVLLPRRPSQARPPSSVGPLAGLLGPARVPVRPVLRAGRLSLDELSRLAPGTVVRLDAEESTPFELRVAGQTVFVGAVARREGRCTFSPKLRRGPAAPEKEGQA